MIFSRSRLFWTVLAAYVAGFVFWSIYVPYAPDRLFKAIPERATVVSAHFNLAARWDDLRANPLTASFLKTLGITDQDLQQTTSDPEFRTWLNKLASDELVVAYVPSLGPSQKPCWIVASWIGGRSQRLRWLLSTQKGLRPYQVRRTPVWSIRPKGWKMDQPLRVAMVEGIAVACIGGDPYAMDEVLGCFDGDRQSIFEQKELTLKRTPQSGPDRGWFESSESRRGIERVFYNFTSLSGRGVGGSLLVPDAMPAAPVTNTALADVERMWDSRPLAWIVADKQVALTWLTGFWRYPWASGVIDVVGTEAGGPVALGLFGGDFSGRFKGLKLPTLMVAGPVPDGAAALEHLRARMDVLNARLRWGLVARELTVGERHVYAIEGTGQNLYSTLELNEQVGYTAGTNWLLFSSNTEGLTNVLVAADREPGAGGGLKSRDPAPAYGWINLEKGGKALRLAITAYAFKIGLQDPQGSYEERQRLNVAKAWIDALAPLGELSVSARPEGEQTRIAFEAGKRD